MTYKERERAAARKRKAHQRKLAQARKHMQPVGRKTSGCPLAAAPPVAVGIGLIALALRRRK